MHTSSWDQLRSGELYGCGLSIRRRAYYRESGWFRKPIQTLMIKLKLLINNVIILGR